MFQPPAHIAELCEALRQGLRLSLGEKLFAIYLYGAITFPESNATGDIDFHVILTEALSEVELHAIQDLHDALGRDYPPLGSELDGYYILLADARQAAPPVHQLRLEIRDVSWALHRAHILAGRCIVLYGPDPKETLPSPTWPELELALRSELKFVQDHLEDYPDYCILNLCRIIYSFETRDVVISKTAAAAWANQALPQYRRHIALAQRSYAHQATPQDREFMLAEVRGFFNFACQRIDLL
jgi:hypothetical protein